ncbi:MAG: M48 family metallopeptidase [Desulfobacteraceae bacterium]|nr:M48 family metallopeptidase [Desulfobacteraceae bacterium]MBC2756250.1 M48 family metallopeptidase [Desulfobacteraceae bacterium]
MNFFEHQEQSKRKTALLVVLFALAVIGIVLAVYTVIMGVIYTQKIESASGDISSIPWLDPNIFGGVALAVLLVIIGGSLFKIIALKRGGQYIAESLGGRLVNPSTSDLEEKKLINVVEEMALAAGTPVPLAYVLDREKGINAFAAGYSPNDAVVAVTDGCLRRLTRDELQGVVAHEFSHVLNGDMRLNIRLIGMISGIMIIASIGNIILRSGSRSRKNGMPILLIGLSFIVIGYIGVLVSRIIQSAVSRQREYLADASAVQFTRNPPGIANALKKIGGFSKGSKVNARLASETSHMFFSMAISSLFATHPPIKQRIRRIDPAFTGEFPSISDAKNAVTQKDPSIMGLADGGEPMEISPENISETIGSIDSNHVKYSLMLLKSIPQPIRNELNDPMGASAVVFSMLLDTDANEKKRQLDSLKQVMPEEIVRHVSKLDETVKNLDRGLKLPLLDLSLPMLRRMSDKQFQTFKQAISILVESDGKLNLFEYALQLIITNRLEAAFRPAAKKRVFKSIELLKEDAVILISKLAIEGHENPSEAEKAFASAMMMIPASPNASPNASNDAPGDLQMVNRPFHEVGTAISRFACSAPGVKKTMLDACAHCILFDRRVSVKEAELLRAIAYALDLPVPPFLVKKGV